MQQKRKILAPVTISVGDSSDPAADAAGLVRLAISRRFCLAAVYNKTAMTLAPQILYTRHDEPYVDAVVVERDGQPPKEVKLGTFKIVGLKGLALSGRPFTAFPGFDANVEKYVGNAIIAVTPAA
jgi:hypothetical protein